jgi:magnesium transporter
MVRNPFFLRPDAPLAVAAKEVLNRHYPVYPVCDEDGRLVGTVRGYALFEAQAFEISAQAGSMVGVEKGERLVTPWLRSLRLRHPWLQFNLLTGFLSAAVVGFFQETIDHMVILAVFLPVLSGQASNTGSQALAISVRGMTLGDFGTGTAAFVLRKEALLGLLNGLLVGISAGLAMLGVAVLQDSPHPVTLAAVVFLAMTGSCLVGGVAGVAIPLTLRRFGTDPASAASILLTTIAEVASIALFLGLASWAVGG